MKHFVNAFSEDKILKETGSSKKTDVRTIPYRSNQLNLNSSISSNVSNSSNLNNYRINKIRFCPAFLAEFGFIIILLIIMLFLLIPQYHPSKKYMSKIVNTTFDSNYKPKIFLHFSDILLSKGLSYKLDGSLLFLNSFLNYKPDLILFTGNIVDNYKGKTENNIKPGCQSPEDWKIYNISLKPELCNYNVIDVAGNHDIWGVDTVNSELNYFLDYSFMFNRENIKNDDDFTIRKINILNKTFILFNDFRFPTPRPPYGDEPHTSKHQLDLLENMIDNLEEEECYILTHFFVDRAWLIKSSKGHYFEEIISNKKVAGIFTGHSYLLENKIIHHGEEGGLEYSTPSVFSSKRSGLITIDNGNLIYHNVYIPYPNNRTLFFVSYPAPNNQISSHHIFNLNNFDIRIISYAPEKNIKLFIEGDINGELQYSLTLDNGAFLYSYPVNLSDGDYKIHIYDNNNYNCDINIEFTVGKEYMGKKETKMINKRTLLGNRFLYLFFILYLFIIITPFKYEINFRKIRMIESYINGNIFIRTNKLLIYLYILLLNPFILRKNFQQMKKVTRYIIFIASLYPLVLPVHFFNKINKKIGFMFNVFIVIGSNTRYEHSALEITFLFYLVLIYPNVLLVSGLKYYESLLIIYINVYIFFVCFIFNIWINFLLLIESLSLGYLFFSTGYVICSILIFFGYIIGIASDT